MQELKDKYLEILVEKIDFDLPENIVEQETNQLLNNKASKMSEEELNKLKDDKEAIQKMVQELEPEAKQSVKVTFLIDSLAKAENVEVSDDEVTQTLYYEAIMSGQEPKAFIEKYEKSGYLPVIKMSMLENKVLTKIFDEAAK
jgi:trigger factor